MTVGKELIKMWQLKKNVAVEGIKAKSQQGCFHKRVRYLRGLYCEVIQKAIILNICQIIKRF